MPKQIYIREAADAQKLAQPLIAAHHGHLRDARITFLFTTQKRRKCDRVRLGSAAKLSALQRYWSSLAETDTPSVQAGYDFLILIDHEEWGFMKPEQREALVDHELCHCWRYVKETKKGTQERWGLRGHDVEEFTEIIARHGPQWREVREFIEVAAQQLPLPTATEREPALSVVR
jgi:hypothetical protein